MTTEFVPIANIITNSHGRTKQALTNRLNRIRDALVKVLDEHPAPDAFGWFNFDSTATCSMQLVIGELAVVQRGSFRTNMINAFPRHVGCDEFKANTTYPVDGESGPRFDYDIVDAFSDTMYDYISEPLFEMIFLDNEVGESRRMCRGRGGIEDTVSIINSIIITLQDVSVDHLRDIVSHDTLPPEFEGQVEAEWQKLREVTPPTAAAGAADDSDPVAVARADVHAATGALELAKIKLRYAEELAAHHIKYRK